MKFQNPSIYRSKVNRRTQRLTDSQTDKPKAICPSNFFKVGGEKVGHCANTVLAWRLYRNLPKVNASSSEMFSFILT